MVHLSGWCGDGVVVSKMAAAHVNEKCLAGTHDASQTSFKHLMHQVNNCVYDIYY